MKNHFPPNHKDWIKFKIRRKNKNDAYIEVYLSKDHIEAKADFFPAKEKGRPFTKEYIDLVLKKLNICCGIEYKAIDDAADDCNENLRENLGVIIARGFIPVDDSPAYFKINPNMTPPRLQNEPGAGEFNIHSSVYIQVKEGDELARLQDAVQGRVGKTVTGKEVPFKFVQRKELVESEGVYIKNNCIYAKISGQLMIEENCINVKDTLCVNEKIGCKTGDVDFSGNVIIKGPVADGFKVYSGGDITVRETFFVSDCLSAGDLRVSGGIIGRKQGIAKVNGSITARFIQNCKIACKKDVKVSREIINSNLWVMGDLDLGDSGVIVSSKINSFCGLRAGRIGGRTAQSTIICLGDDWMVAREIELIKQRLFHIKRDLAALTLAFKKQKELGKSGLEKLNAITKTGRSLIKEYKETQIRLEQNKKNIKKNENATLIAFGKIYAGTFVKICNAQYPVIEDLNRVRFMLDKTRNCVVCKKL
ncbi:MAG: FapA family protein [Spirochaetaceae bacterium]|jgi:uncharacterized protein (DUF342 family)|nr:FapA family protein [Spirochaetaceae bacterium]